MYINVYVFKITRKLTIFINSKISFYHHRSKRDGSSSPPAVDNAVPHKDTEEPVSQRDAERKAYLEQSPRQGRGWCKDSHGVFCMLYNVFKGDKSKVPFSRILSIANYVK